MAFENKETAVVPTHHVVMEERSSLSVSGVEEVDSFDENTISLSTCQGALVIRGENLHIEKLSLDGGDLRLEGSIDSLTYEENKSKGGLLSRLLG